MFVTARWPLENYELLIEIDKKYNKKLFKGQSRKGKKARQYEPSNKDSITSGYVTALNGLEVGQIKNLLQRVLNCDMEMKGLITEGKGIMKRGRFNFKLKELMGRDNDEQVLKRLGRNTVNALFVQYGYAFSAAKNNVMHGLALAYLPPPHLPRTHGFDSKALLPLHTSFWTAIRINNLRPPWLTHTKYRASIRHLLSFMQTRGSPMVVRHILSHM